MSKMVTVTGAGGFIGSHLVEALLKRGDAVTGLVQYNSRRDVGNLRFIPEDLRKLLTIHHGDIRDPECVRSICEDKDVVFHLAALIGIPYSYEAPRAYVETNITGTMNVLERAHWGGFKVVTTSTSEVYGTALFTPITEHHPIQAQSPYSATKAAADLLCEAYHKSFDVNVAVVRPFNTYGPRQSARAVIPTIIGQLLSGVEELELGSLWPTRDMLFVEDTVAAFIAASESEAAVGRVTHFGTGTAISVGELAKMLINLIAQGTGIAQDAERVRPKGSEVGELICDATVAKDLLGWTPKTDIVDGLKQTIRFMQDHREFWTTGYTT